MLEVCCRRRRPVQSTPRFFFSLSLSLSLSLVQAPQERGVGGEEGFHWRLQPREVAKVSRYGKVQVLCMYRYVRVLCGSRSGGPSPPCGLVFPSPSLAGASLSVCLVCLV
ncbi:hypothetical protein K504DRAFT_228700 [Pleomassaria siparia CBS 279.74]|uniref:Secreted protein n=1 Tax=Pleomassaria siparia CBS 279.74 TaxID=1314801 RepID=A0A6G1KG02_9PLEO|nr:hypothetical protein K504DRAFT_228700 [Pleomassaria siparia CBS 279.74]